MTYTKRELWGAFTAIALTLFLGSLDMAAIPTALPAIASSFSENTGVSWIMTAYMLGATVTAPIYGKLSDIYGSRRMLLIALLIFMCGALLCTTASNVYLLISFRLLQGFGSGGLMVLAFITIGRIVPVEKQGWYQGLLAGIFAFAALIGPLLGGIVAQYLSWRWIFIIYLPLVVTALILAYKFLKPMPAINQGRQVDIIGAILLTLWIIDLLFLINQFSGGASSGVVVTPKLIGLCGGAIIFLIMFILQEKRVENPLIPLKLFHNQNFAISVLAILISSISSFAATFFLPQYFQLVMEVSPTVSGLLLEPVQIGMIIGPIFGGWLSAKFMSYRSCLLLWVSLIAIMYFMLAWPHDILLVSIIAIPTLILLGAALGVIMPLMTVAIQNSVDKSNIGTATATLGLARSLGSLIGGVLFGMVYSSGLSWQLLNSGLNTTTIQKVLQNGVAIVTDLPMNEHKLVVGAFSNAFNILFLIAGILAAISLGIILLMKRQNLQTVDNK